MAKIKLMPVCTGREVERAITAAERRRILDAADSLPLVGGRSKDRNRYRGKERPMRKGYRPYRIVSKTKIPDAAIERNRAWIAAIANSLGRRGDSELLRETMRDTGKKCAEQLFKKIINHFGRPPESVAELIEAINMRRKEVLNASNFWSRDENKAHFKLEKCGCDLVQAGLAESDPNYCLCSVGMFESIFTPFCKGTAKTDIIKAIGFCDNCCEFVVHFEE